jgi:photosystem II stability/assembly factor-like uncharacterized protein
MEDPSHALLIAYPSSSIDPATTFTTTDGGKTWQQGADLSNRDRYGSIIRSGSLLCAVGHGVTTSRNDGATWSYDGAPTGGGLTSVQLVGSHLTRSRADWWPPLQTLSKHQRRQDGRTGAWKLCGS